MCRRPSRWRRRPSPRTTWRPTFHWGSNHERRHSRCRDGRLRLHGRGPLTGLAHGGAVLRPPAAAGHGGARRLVEQGRIGEIRHVRAVYLQDWIVDPEFPLVWRLQKDKAGSGALGDIGAHIVDMAQFVTGDRISGVSALTETFIKERPLPE